MTAEPTFTITARDPSFAAILNMWAAIKRMDPDSNPAAIAEAERLANEGVSWMDNQGGFQPDGMRALSRGLCVLAELVGAVVTIDQVPLEPLAMGHYRHRVDVRFKRGPAT